MSRDTDFAQMWLDRKDEEDLYRRKLEEKNLKNLDPIVAHMGFEMIGLDEVRDWWLYFYIIGRMDPPNELMMMQGEFKVSRLEATLARMAASADVYSDPHRERRWKVLVDSKGGKDPYSEGLDDL